MPHILVFPYHPAQPGDRLNDAAPPRLGVPSRSHLSKEEMDAYSEPLSDGVYVTYEGSEEEVAPGVPKTFTVTKTPYQVKQSIRVTEKSLDA